MTKYIVTGGKQRIAGDKTTEWNGYDEAVSILFDDEKMQGQPFFNYRAPREHLPDDPDASITFKSASIQGNHLVVSTTTEILKIAIPERKLESVVSLPVFNDVHHVFVNSRGNYVVTSTGLDAVFEVTPSGEIVDEWSTFEESIWTNFDKSIDYRKVLTTKPHRSHPNHCVEIGGQYWASRLKQRDFYNLMTGESAGFPERPHDGLIQEDHVYFTHVTGMVTKLHFPTRQVDIVLDANDGYNDKRMLGWCRGLHINRDGDLIIGFTRLRPTKYENAFHWAKRVMTNSASYYGCQPTRLAKYSRKGARLMWEFDLEPHDINAVFSILPLNGA